MCACGLRRMLGKDGSNELLGGKVSVVMFKFVQRWGDWHPGMCHSMMDAVRLSEREHART
jgi:hypothetical protein